MGGDRVFLAFPESNFLPRTQIAGIFRDDNVWYVCMFVCLCQTERNDDDWYERERERREREGGREGDDDGWCVCVYVCVNAYVCVCVCEREREREREIEREKREGEKRDRERECVCVCEREREREKETSLEMITSITWGLGCLRVCMLHTYIKNLATLPKRHLRAGEGCCIIDGAAGQKF
jgi:hypothetical protein